MNTQFIQLSALKGALRMEIMGMKRSKGPSAYSILKKQFGLKGTKEEVLKQVEIILNDPI